MLSSNRTQPPIPENLRREIELSVEARHNKKEWGGHKHQILCSPNIFDLGKPPRRVWDKTKTDVHRRIKNTRKWIEHFGRIRNKMGEIVPIQLNHAQRSFLAKVLRRWRNGQSARVVILKPRQTGFSTVVELIIFYLTVTATFKRGCVIAHKNSISTKILNIFRTALKFMPYELPTKHRTRYEVVFDDPINGSVDVDSAESDEPGHGDTVQYLHLTEVSRWKDAARKAKGVMQTVPDMPVTLIAWESTANGAEGYFYDLYWLAKDTDNPANRMDAVFVAWFEHAEYTATALSEAELDYIHRTMDQEEVDLLEQRYFVRKRGWVAVTMEQLAWRRRAIADKCGGDLEAFHEQYPAYELEAFLSSGRPVFNAQKLIERDRAVRDPVFRGDLIDSDFEPPKEPDTPEGLSALTEKTPAGPHAFHVEQSPPRPEFLNPEVTDEPVAVPEPEEPPIGPDQDPNWQ